MTNTRTPGHVNSNIFSTPLAHPTDFNKTTCANSLHTCVTNYHRLNSLHCLTAPRLASPRVALPHLALPHLTLPCLTLRCLASPCQAPVQSMASLSEASWSHVERKTWPSQKPPGHRETQNFRWFDHTRESEREREIARERDI